MSRLPFFTSVRVEGQAEKRNRLCVVHGCDLYGWVGVWYGVNTKQTHSMCGEQGKVGTAKNCSENHAKNTRKHFLLHESNHKKVFNLENQPSL
jgi:hypothetical protein